MFRTGLRALGDAALLQRTTPNRAIGRRIYSIPTPAPSRTLPLAHSTLLGQLRTYQTTTARTATRSLRTQTRFSRPQQQRPFHGTRPRRGEDRRGKHEKPHEEEPQSLSGRLKKLTREYGWVALGVYLGLSVLDFPFCFLLVRTVGSEKIAHVEHIVVSSLLKLVPESVQQWWAERRGTSRGEGLDGPGELEVYGHGVAQAEERRKQEGASLATELALAYAIHKSFIFVRVPLTAAVTPKVVKVLRSWGWQIGKNPLKNKKGKR
ncbi:hypothetical protein VTJ04DRAFT_9981 [Mycothermus thermophilus]|uniref:uncharacterized protein n=1 Tax=Humicola insolens TaxID=85995 RepID=UPI003742C13C